MQLLVELWVLLRPVSKRGPVLVWLCTGSTNWQVSSLGLFDHKTYYHSACVQEGCVSL